MNYFVVNKELDVRRGYTEGVCWKENRLTLLPERKEGAFFSRVFDSQEDQTVWHRFVMEGEGQGQASVSVTFYASDDPTVLVDGTRYAAADFIRDPGHSLSQKKQHLEAFLQKQVLYPKDCLLHEVKGRYLFFLAELFMQGGQSPFLSQMILYFPKEDWLKYLPGVYQREEAGADFTSRYLGIFQSFYDDMDRRIRNSSSLLNPHTAPMDCLEEIAGWFQMKNIYLWPKKALRKLLKGAPEILGKAGTVEGLLDILTLYMGEEPLLIECGMLKGTKEEMLYPGDPYTCILLVKEKYLSVPKEYEALMCLARQMKPAHMEVKLVPLKARLTLGTYTYLGINSELRSYQPARLDGGFSLAFSAVGTARAKGGDEG